jgi:hypothetical protein
MPNTTAEELALLTDTVAESTTSILTHLEVSANVVRNMIETQTIFLKHIIK